MLLINGEKALTEDEYREQLAHMIAILEFAREQIRNVQDLPRTTIGDRSKLLRDVHETLVLPAVTFVHTLQTDLNALIHEKRSRLEIRSHEE